MDEIWVPSHFNKHSFAQAGVPKAKLFVLPEAVDTEVEFNPQHVKQVYPLHNGSDRMYKFLSVAKWEHRKGMDVLLRAYLHNFTRSDSVILYIKTQHHHASPEVELQRITLEVASELGVEPDRLPLVELLINVWTADSDMPGLYAAADAFVLPSRGEGWGRPQVEAMAMGLPVILTDWSGPTEYLNRRVALPVKYDLVTMTDSDIRDMLGPDADLSVLHSHKWAEPSVEHLQERMRWCFDNQVQASLLGARGREHMRTKFSPRVVGNLLASHLDDITSKLQAA